MNLRPVALETPLAADCWQLVLSSRFTDLMRSPLSAVSSEASPSRAASAAPSRGVKGLHSRIGWHGIELEHAERGAASTAITWGSTRAGRRARRQLEDEDLRRQRLVVIFSTSRTKASCPSTSSAPTENKASARDTCFSRRPV